MKEIVGLVPAAGGGTRLYPFARAVPKEMYPILGKAVIEHCVENLKEGGAKKIFMVVGYQKGALMDYLGDGSFFGVDVAYIYQLQRKGLGHAILQGSKWIDTTFITLLGDSFIEPKEELKTLVNLHQKETPIATVMLFKVKDPKGYGIVKFKDAGSQGEIEKMVEKPSPEEAREYETNGEYYALCGAYVFEPGIFEYLKQTPPGARGEVQITDAMALALRKGEKIVGMPMKGKYLDIGKWRTVLNVEKNMIASSNIEEHITDRERMMDKIKSREDL